MMEFIECKAEGGEEGPHADRARLRVNFNGEAYSSILFQNANLSVRVSDEFMQAVDDDKPWTTHWVTDPSKAGPELSGPRHVRQDGRVRPGTAAIRACSTTRRSTAGTPARTRAGSTPRIPCSEYMFLDDTACNLASINLMKFRRDDGTFDVERFQAACRMVFIAQEILVDHASYPTQADRRQQPSLPAAGAGLLEPGQPDHGERPALRLGRGPRAVRRDDGPAARRGLPAPAPSWPRRSGRSTATRRTASRCCT